MKVCGWKQRAMFDRYDIINEANFTEAVAKRFNGKPAAIWRRRPRRSLS